jgi:hypothetical protein
MRHYVHYGIIWEIELWKIPLEFWKYNEPWRKVIINKTPDSDKYFLQVYDYHFDDKKNLVKKILSYS